MKNALIYRGFLTVVWWQQSRSVGSRMKRMIGMAAAAALVLLQLGAFAVLNAQAPHDLAPIDAPELVAEQRA